PISNLSDGYKAAVRARHRAFDHYQVLIGVDLPDGEAPDRDVLGAHATGFLRSLERAGGIRRAARLRFAVNHRAVCHVPTVEVVSLNHAGESFALRYSAHLHHIAGLQHIARADFQTHLKIGRIFDANLAQRPLRLRIRMFRILQPAADVPELRHVDVLGRHLSESDLGGGVAISIISLNL